MILFYIFDNWKLICIIIIIIAITSYLYIKYFWIVNKYLFLIFRIGSYLSVVIVIVFWILVMILPKNFGKSYIMTNYKYLYSPDRYLWRSRILDGNDTMPQVRNVKDSDEIKVILSDEAFIGEMLRGLIQNNLPCVFSYHVKKNDDGYKDEPVPNFIILNKKFDIVNNIGKNINFFTKILGIDKNIFGRFIINTIGINELQGPFYFIFNANISGGSLNPGEEVLKHSTLYKWEKNPDFLNFRLQIQITCISVLFYRNEIIIEPVILDFAGKLAFCVQDFLIRIEKHRVSSTTQHVVYGEINN